MTEEKCMLIAESFAYALGFEKIKGKHVLLGEIMGNGLSITIESKYWIWVDYSEPNKIIKVSLADDGTTFNTFLYLTMLSVLDVVSFDSIG